MADVSLIRKASTRIVQTCWSLVVKRVLLAACWLPILRHNHASSVWHSVLLHDTNGVITVVDLPMSFSGFFFILPLVGVMVFHLYNILFVVSKVTMTPERIREMKATFKECDTDGSGDVSRSEFIEGIQNAGQAQDLGIIVRN